MPFVGSSYHVIGDVRNSLIWDVKSINIFNGISDITLVHSFADIDKTFFNATGICCSLWNNLRIKWMLLSLGGSISISTTEDFNILWVYPFLGLVVTLKTWSFELYTRWLFSSSYSISSNMGALSVSYISLDDIELINNCLLDCFASLASVVFFLTPSVWYS